MEQSELAIVAMLVIAYAMVSGRLGRAPVTGPMLFIAAGIVLGPEVFDVLALSVEKSSVLVLAQATLAVVLFSDAVRIDIRALRFEYEIPARLLGIGLPLTIISGLGAALLLIPDLSWQEAGLLAAILAPTDAALGEAVVSDQRIPVRIRQSLNVESGLNDGLALPVVTIFLTLIQSEREGRSAASWFDFLARQIGFGLMAGVAVGAISAWVLGRAHRAGWVEGIAAQLAGLAVPALALTCAELIDGNGFIAAFTAGLAFKAVAGGTGEHLTEYAEDSSRLLALLSFLVFGNVLVGPVLGQLDLQVLATAVAALTVVRMIPVAISLIGTHLEKPTVVFLGWFGPRGLASVLFALIVFEEAAGPVADELFAVAAWTVMMSAVAHGASASWGARRYARWYEDKGGAEAEEDEMPEAGPMTHSRVRGEPRHP